MLEVRVYHKDVDNFPAYMPNDIYGQSFNTILNNADLCNYLTFDGQGIDLIDENLKFYEQDDYLGYTFAPSDDNRNCNIDDLGIYVGTTTEIDAYPERISICFKDNCCAEIEITYNNGRGLPIQSETIYVNSKIITIKLPRGYYTVNIKFKKTIYSNQNIRISSFIYGEINTYNKFKSHNLIEEINVLSDDLPINQFEASFVIPDLNDMPFSKKDPLVLFNNSKYYGTFYITNAQRSAKTFFDVTAQNALYILDKTSYKGWRGASSTKYISDKIELYSGIKIKNYNDELTVNGDFKDPSCRMILAGAGFAVGHMIDGSRSGDVSLIPIPSEISSVILNKDRRIIGDAVLKRCDEISTATIEATLPVSSLDAENTVTISTQKNKKTIFKFDKPVSINSVSDSTIIFKDMYSVEFIPNNASTTISYYDIIDQVYIETVTNPNAIVENEKKFKQLKVYGGYLVFQNGVYIEQYISRALDVEKYIKSRGKVNAKIRLRNEKVGDLIQIETAWDGIITGIITKMDITFGYEDIANIEVLEWSL